MEEYNNNENTNEKGGWMSNIFDSISKVLNNFINVFKRHGFFYTLLLLIILITSYTLIINPVKIDKIVENRFNEVRKMEQEQTEQAINRRYEADMIVGDIMTKIIDKFPDIHRVLVLEAHNSIKSLQSVDFLYYSCSMEMLTPNSRHLIYLSDDLQRQIRANLIGNNMINTLKHREYIHYDSIAECKHPDHRLIHKLASTGDNECLLIPYLNNNNEPVIIMVISGDNLPVKDIIEYVADFKKQIENCLM